MKIHYRPLCLAALALQIGVVHAADAPVMIKAPAFTLPLSSYLSPEAQAAFIERSHGMLPMPPAVVSADAVKTYREAMDAQYFAPLLTRAKARYPVAIESTTIGGVKADVVTPQTGIAARNKERVLINLHGGAFMIGAGMGGQVEAIPIASVGSFKVVTVDYRQGPEHRFPAASEDVAAVYKELLKTYRPENIGIYGCSAGGALTAMSMAWFQKEKLPKPGAIGIFCSGAGGAFGGDSRFTSMAAAGYPAPPPSPNPPPIPMAYLDGASLNDPLVSPDVSTTVLARFPPTLIITETRSGDLSAAVNSHNLLVKAGVETDLHVWDGLWHGFIYDVRLPETRDAFDVTVKFFDRHLGKKPK